MSHDASTSAAAAASDAPPPSDQQRLSNLLLRSLSRLPAAVEAGGGATTTTTTSGNPPTTAASDDAATERRRRQRREVLARHATVLDGLIRSLDIVAYAQMSILYYMDNSLMRLLLRLIPHWLFFTPKPAAFPPPPKKRPYVVHVALANLTCALLHLLLAAPAASEATRGYLHGGFLIDFVGERGPVSKVRLLGADCAVLVVQVVMLAAVRERERMRDAMGGGGGGGGGGPREASSSAAETGASTTTGEEEEQDLWGQDYDAEEQGIRREWAQEPFLPADGEEEEGYGGDRAGNEEGEDDDDDEASHAVRKEQHPLDRFYTGEFVVADLHIWDAILASWKESST